MIVFIAAVVVLAGLSIAMFKAGDSGYEGRHVTMGMFGILGCIISFIGVIFIGVLSLEWAGAASKAGIINREYGTNYTQAEVFYASSVIDTVRELDRKRYEVNGDFRREADPNVQARRQKATP